MSKVYIIETYHSSGTRHTMTISKVTGYQSPQSPLRMDDPPVFEHFFRSKVDLALEGNRTRGLDMPMTMHSAQKEKGCRFSYLTALFFSPDTFSPTSYFVHVPGGYDMTQNPSSIHPYTRTLLHLVHFLHTLLHTP
ncbi:hypothetical protein H2248_008123 [Termitomyces sp. 'cryptogamus']|nr:hypothetical protein H2248_008123 [Termitomyces sp. 'cryptogamus']